MRYDWPAGRLVISTLCRLLLVPLLMLCAAPRGNPFISREPWPIALSAVLGVTNGYFGSVPMILAPSKVPDHQKELTGNKILRWNEWNEWKILFDIASYFALSCVIIYH